MIAELQEKLRLWRKAGLALLSIGMGLCGGAYAASGTWTVTSSTATSASGSYTTPQGNTGTFTLTRTASSGYTTTANFYGGSAGLDAVNNPSNSSNGATDGGDTFTYNLVLTPTAGQNNPLTLEVVQSPYSSTNSGGNSEPATIKVSSGTGGSGFTVQDNPAVSMFYNADGDQINTLQSGSSSSTPATIPQLRYTDTTPALVYSNASGIGSVKNTYTALTSADYPPILAGTTFASGSTIQSFGAANTTSAYKITVPYTSPQTTYSLTLVYTANMQGTSGLPGNWTAVGETFKEWIGFGVTSLPSPTITVQKGLDTTGGRYADTDQFTMQILQGGTPVTVPGTPTTSGSGTSITSGTGTTGAYKATSGTAYTINEAVSGTTNLSNYTQSLSCKNSNTGSATTLPTALGGSITPTWGDAITCTITNTRRSRTLTVTKALTPTTDSGQFVMNANGKTGTAAGNGATSSTSVFLGANATFSEAASGTTNLNNYVSSIQCVQTGTSTAVPFTPASAANQGGSLTMPDTDVTCTITNAAKADLSITKTGPSSAVAGTQITYTLTLSNAGPSAANGATYSDNMPNNLTGVTATCVNATSGVSGCTANVGSGNNVTGAVGTFPSGGSVQIQITGTIPPGATAALNNSATITAPSGTTDPTTSNNTSATVNTTLTKTADVSVTKTDNVSVTSNGSTLTYTIVLSNAGPSYTTVNFVDTSFTGVTLSNWTCSVTSGTSNCPTSLPTSGGYSNSLLPMNPGSVLTFQVTGTVTASSGTVSNTAIASVPSGVTDPTPGNNSATDTDTLLTRVTITKVSNGGTGTFSFSGTNNATGGITQSITTTAAGGSGTSNTTQTLTSSSTSTTITESAPPAGWVLDSISCTGLGAGGTATPTINGASGGSVLLDAAATAPGATINCTFTNNKLAKLTITKFSTTQINNVNFTQSGMLSTATGSPNAATATTFALNPVQVSTAVYSASQTYTNVKPNVALTFSELNAASVNNYTLTSISCTDNNGAPSGSTSDIRYFPTATNGNPLGTVVETLVPGADVTCTFTNIKNAQIVLTKNTVGGNGIGTFTFSETSSLSGTTVTPTSPFTITTAAGTGAINTQVAGLTATTNTNLTITESATAGYQLTGITCRDTAANTTLTTTTTPSATVTLASGQVVLGKVGAAAVINCTFTNTKLPTITIKKQSNGGIGTFKFGSGSNGLPSAADSLTLTTTATTNPATSGLYTVTDINSPATLTETTLPSGWTLQGWDCKTGTGVSVASGSGSMSIPASALQQGNDLTCTFTNTASYNVTLSKTWGNGLSGDQVSLTIANASQTTIGSGSSTVGGSSTSATASVLSGAKFYVTEAFTKGVSSNYSTPILNCTSGGTPVSMTQESAYSYSFTMQTADIACTYTNNRKSASLQLVKTWTNGKTGDIASIGATSGGTNNTTLFTATAPTGGDSGPSVKVYAGDIITLPGETMNPGSLSNYTTTLTCTGGGTQSGTNGKLGTNTLTIKPADDGAAIICTYNNTRFSQQFTLVKNWGAGSVSGDTASVTTTGDATVSFSATAPNSASSTTITVYAGDSINLPVETLSRSLYQVKVACAGGSLLSSKNPATSVTITTSSTPTTCTYTNSIPALSITKTNPGSLTVGTTSDYSISVSNTGSVATTGSSTVSDTIPSGLTIGTLPSGCTASGQTVTCTIASGLAVGGSVSFNIPVTPTVAVAGTPITNTATVTGGGTPCTTSTCSSTTSALTVTGYATLSISKGVTAATTTSNYILVKADPVNSTSLTYSPAQQMDYYLTVNNTSDIPASGVTVTDTLLSSLTFVSATLNGNPISNDGTGQNLSFNVGSLAAHASQTIVVTVSLTVTPNTNQSAVQNTASTSATGVTAVSSNTTTTNLIYTKAFKQVHNVGSNPGATVPLPTPAWSDAGTGYPTEQLEYCIDFTNYSNMALTNYVVSDTIPTNTTYVAGSAYVLTGSMSSVTTANPTPSYMSITPTFSGGLVSATIPSLAPGTTGSLCFRASIK